MTFDEMDAAISKRALAIWRVRETEFQPRVRRMEPDDFDHASGAWWVVYRIAALELGLVCESPAVALEGESIREV